MNNLNEKMKERLDKWRKETEKIKFPSQKDKVSRRNGKNDYGDASTLEEWNEEAKRSQTRK